MAGIGAAMERKYPGGRWVTMRGKHVYIKKDGSIAEETMFSVSREPSAALSDGLIERLMDKDIDHSTWITAWGEVNQDSELRRHWEEIAQQYGGDDPYAFAWYMVDKVLPLIAEPNKSAIDAFDAITAELRNTSTFSDVIVVLAQRPGDWAAIAEDFDGAQGFYKNEVLGWEPEEEEEKPQARKPSEGEIGLREAVRLKPPTEYRRAPSIRLDSYLGREELTYLTSDDKHDIIEAMASWPARWDTHEEAKRELAELFGFDPGYERFADNFEGFGLTELTYITEAFEDVFKKFPALALDLNSLHCGLNSFNIGEIQASCTVAGVYHNSRIGLNPKMYGPWGVRRRMTSQLDDIARWNAWGDGTPRSIVHHELGHALHNTLFKGGLSEEVSQAISTLQKALYDRWKLVSQYSTTNPAELLAEAFTEYIGNPDADESVQEFGRTLEELYDRCVTRVDYKSKAEQRKKQSREEAERAMARKQREQQRADRVAAMQRDHKAGNQAQGRTLEDYGYLLSYYWIRTEEPERVHGLPGGESLTLPLYADKENKLLFVIHPDNGKIYYVRPLRENDKEFTVRPWTDKSV